MAKQKKSNSDSNNADKPKNGSKTPPTAQTVKPAKRPKKPTYFDYLSPEEQVEEMRRMQQESEAYDAARDIVPQRRSGGGLITPRGQGKVSRTRKAKMY